jgi:hypothetical protein
MVKYLPTVVERSRRRDEELVDDDRELFVSSRLLPCGRGIDRRWEPHGGGECYMYVSTRGYKYRGARGLPGA